MALVLSNAERRVEVLRHRADVLHRVAFGFVIPARDRERGDSIENSSRIDGRKVLLGVAVGNVHPVAGGGEIAAGGGVDEPARRRARRTGRAEPYASGRAHDERIGFGRCKTRIGRVSPHQGSGVKGVGVAAGGEAVVARRGVVRTAWHGGRQSAADIQTSPTDRGASAVGQIAESARDRRVIAAVGVETAAANRAGVIGDHVGKTAANE